MFKTIKLITDYARYKSQAESASTEKEARIGSLTAEKDDFQLQLREAQTLVEQLKHKTEHLEVRCNDLQ